MPRIYVASLTDYTHGELHGAWIDAAQDPDAIMSEVQAMLKASPTAREFGSVAEEWRIDDYDEFGEVEIGEWDSVEQVSAIAKLLDGWSAPIVAYFINEGYDVNEIDDKISSMFAGEYDGEDEKAVAGMAYQELEDREDIPEDLKSHLSAIAESVANDYWQSGDYFTIYAGNGTSYVMGADR